MDFVKYYALALRTASQTVDAKHDVLHAAMGLVTESAELIDALKKHHAYGRPIDWVNLREEIGDVLWYLPLLCRGLVIDPVAIRSNPAGPVLRCAPPTFDDVLKVASGLMAHASMILTSATGITSMPLERTTVERTLSVLDTLAAGYLGTTLDEVGEINIAKLRARYRDKFTTEAALNRNLDAERAILEGRAP
jgi:hypothetical protein